MLHNQRKRLQELEEREARGEILWTEEFDENFRNKVLLAFQKCSQSSNQVASRARDAIMMAEGLRYLQSDRHRFAIDDLLNYLLECNNEMVPTVIEAMALALGAAGSRSHSDSFRQFVETILRQHRISFDFIDGQMVEFTSRVLHVNVVKPTLTLLARAGRFDTAETAFKKALKEISNGDAGDAITDTGTALQQVLEELGCDGNALGELIKSAKRKQLLGAHDTPMLEFFNRLLNWVAADRSEQGDGHHPSNASIEDAWLTVHVVGALILRLSSDIPRRAVAPGL